MKKITILALHLNYGGVEKYISSLCKMLEDEYEIELLVTYKCEPAFNFSDKIKINYLINEMPNKEKFKKYLKDKKFIKVLIEGIKSLKLLFLKEYLNIKSIKNINSDYIITTRTFHNRLVGRYARKDITKIATEHNYHNNDDSYVQKLINSLKNYDYLVTVSKELMDYYKNKISNVKVIYIPNILDSLPNKKSDLNNNNIISIGRFSKEKDFTTLIRVFKGVKERIKNAKLYLIGDGEEKENIKELIKAYKLEKYVILPGFLSQVEMSKYLMNSKIYVMTSITESFGLVLIEAMSYGLPCIAFDSASGARELIENGKNGYLISNRNIKKMCNKIVDLANNNDIINYSKEALLISKKYLMGNIKKIWIDLLEEKL